MVELIHFQNEKYFKFQSEGFAAQFVFPFAEKICKGKGVDVGFHRTEWILKGSIGIDPIINPQWNAKNFPDFCNELDYIFSSHCLEHIPDWVDVLNYWDSRIKNGGVIFLYLPDYSQKYWRAWNNRKHVSVLSSQILKDYFEDKGYHVFNTGVDLNNSFSVVAIKNEQV